MSRILIAVMGFLAAAMIVLGGVSIGWWSQESGTMRSSIGLRGVEMCRGDDCSHTSLERLERDMGWVRAGAAAYTAALLVGGLALALAGMAVAGRRHRLLAGTGLVASLSAVVTGSWFLAAAPEYPDMQPSYSMIMYFVGAGLGVLAALVALHRAKAGP